MTTDKQSEGAMRAAKRLRHYATWDCGGAIYFEGDDIKTKEERLQEITTIIDEETRPEWIKCAKRMPTEEDGNETGSVMVFHPLFGMAIAQWNTLGLYISHGHTDWLPLPLGPKEG